MTTLRPTLYAHEETPGGSVNWEPVVDDIYLPVEGEKFNKIEECVEMYNKYAEITLEETSKRKRKCGFCGEKTNKHTKLTCPLNPTYIAKLARIAAAQKDGTDASEQATRNVAAEQATNTS